MTETDRKFVTKILTLVGIMPKGYLLNDEFLNKIHNKLQEAIVEYLDDMGTGALSEKELLEEDEYLEEEKLANFNDTAYLMEVLDKMIEKIKNETSIK